MQPVVKMLLMFIGMGVASAITVVGVALIAMGSSGVFSSKDTHVTTTTATTTTTTASTLISDSTDFTSTSSTVSVSSLNRASIYPNGSYSANLTTFTKASDTFALLPVDQTTLTQIGSITDNSSSIIEAGRAQYLYFHLPNSTSTTISARSLSNSTNSSIESNVVTGVAIRFIDDAVDNSIIVIPLPSYGTINPFLPVGIVYYYLPDGSVVVRIEISVPTVLCPQINGKPIDACLSIEYEAYVIVDNTQITSSLSVIIQMACGDVCSLPAGLCSGSCMSCDGQQVAGYDTPVTRRINMGATAASFDLFYETYVIKDRITVWNEGALLFDTTCIGASDTVNITYASNSSYIRVDVEPNCDCALANGCGTAWIFQVFCLNSTFTNRNVKIQKSSAEKATLENYLYQNRQHVF